MSKFKFHAHAHRPSCYEIYVIHIRNIRQTKRLENLARFSFYVNFLFCLLQCCNYYDSPVNFFNIKS